MTYKCTDHHFKASISLDFGDLIIEQHILQVIQQEYGKNVTPDFLLDEFERMQNELEKDVYNAKRKDDLRGTRIIDDYEYSHTNADNDGFVKATREQVKKTLDEIDYLRKHTKPKV